MRNLVLVHPPARADRESFARVAAMVRERDPGIRTRLLIDRPHPLRRVELARRPTFVCSIRPLRRFRPRRGAVAEGFRGPKALELATLGRAGVPVPRWTLLDRERPVPEAEEFGRYVVVKPNRAARGALIRIVSAGRVRWKPRYAARKGAIVQEFIYTGRWPVSYRVTTFFGEVLFAMRAEASHHRRALETRYGWREGERGGGMSIVATARDARFTLCDDAEILALAQRAARAFPDVPLLGVDLVRDVETGVCYVLEVNPNGSTWHFCSPTGRSIQSDHGIHFESQFDGLRVAADALVAQTRQRAS